MTVEQKALNAIQSHPMSVVALSVLSSKSALSPT